MKRRTHYILIILALALSGCLALPVKPQQSVKDPVKNGSDTGNGIPDGGKVKRS